jgi:hypothetical protein
MNTHIGYNCKDELWFRRNNDNSVTVSQMPLLTKEQRESLTIEQLYKFKPLFEITLSVKEWDSIIQVLDEEKHQLNQL